MSNVPANEALKLLLNGNKRFIKGDMVHPHQVVRRRSEIIHGQRPFAVVIGCSDSRVPPEVLFDQGLGDIFVVRVAGATIGNVCIGSLEFAIEHLDVNLVMVMGHQYCGLIKTAAGGDDVHHHLGSLVKTASEAVENTKDMPGDPLENATKENVKLLIDRLEDQSPVIDKHVKSGKVKIVGCYYSLDSGRVDIIE